MSSSSNYDHVKPIFHLNENTHVVDLTMHQEHREKLVQKIKEMDGNVPDHAYVVVQGGKSECRHDTDHELLFRQESNFQYLFGVMEPDCFGAINIHTGASILFIPRLPESYAVWMGEIYPPEYFQKYYAVDEVCFTDEIQKVLSDKHCKDIYTIYGKNLDSGNFSVLTQFDGIENFKVNDSITHPAIVECRMIKTQREIEIMRYTNKISSEAHMEVIKRLRPGVSEYQAESLFKHYCFSVGGSRYLSYTCICGSGSHGAILHYGHAGAPNMKVMQDGDMLMFDMGCEYHCYGSDISRSFPINGKFTQVQREIYDTVYCAQDAVIKAIKPGVQWQDMHRLADKVVCTKLKEYGFLKGDVDEMMDHYIASLFFPHGLGHLIGIDTHDVGGYKVGTDRVNEPGLKSLRLGRALEEGMVVTVEPGVYFNKALLEPAFKDPEVSKYLNIEKLKENMNFGGIRLEDDILVTKDGCENLTVVPRAIEEIEALMKEGREKYGEEYKPFA